MAIQITDARQDSWIPLRNEPVQARSTARLTALLDAAAKIVDEIGFERLTTAMVAERAGASIGTVYRYFPDRIVLLQALAARNLERSLKGVAAAIADPKHTDWMQALSAAMDTLVESFRSEPGFRGLRVGDVIDLRPEHNERTYKSIVAETMLDGLLERFEASDTPELRFAFEAAVEISEALAVRAFTYDAGGDERFLEQGRLLTYQLLSPHLGDAAL